MRIIDDSLMEMYAIARIITATTMPPPPADLLIALTAVRRDGRFLLIQEAASGLWYLPAGRVEPGESFAQAAAREVREEAGIEVDRLRYFGSQSWPFPNSLMIAFRAEWSAGEIRVDPAELADAQWFEPEALPQLPPRMSIARALIDSTLAELAASRG